MSKSTHIVVAIVSMICAAGGIFLLLNGACADLDECIGVRNCPKAEDCSAAFFSAVGGGVGIIVAVLNIVADMEK